MTYRGKRIVGVIPARIAATRLPRKPLLDIAGLPMIAHVIKRAKLSTVLDDLVVATDDEEIAAVARSHGCRALLTSPDHTTGIERMVEIAPYEKADVFVLINGDEAALYPEHIEYSIKTLMDSNAPTALLASPFSKTDSYSDFKVVVNKLGEAMYFSRGDIPSPTRSGVKKFFKAYHIISFRSEFLAIYSKLTRGPLEEIEGHDHLRMLENGIKVQIGIVEHASSSVDTIEDLEQIRREMLTDDLFKLYKPH